MMNKMGFFPFIFLLSLAAAESQRAPMKTDPAPPTIHPKPRTDDSPAAPRKHRRCERYRPPAPLARDAVTSDWPNFLGPTHDGVSPETDLLDRFDRPEPGKPDPLLVWALTRGESYSAPSIQDRRVVYFHRMGDSEIVECLDAETGGLFWSHEYPTTYIDRYKYRNGPRASPAIDGGRVYTLGAQGVLHCFDLRTGHLYWRRKLAEEFHLDQGFFGFSGSPILEGDKLILNLGAGKCVAAFDKITGKLEWLAEDKWGRSYATPRAATVHGKRVVFVFAGGMSKPTVGGLLGLDPETGKIHFRFPWRSSRYSSVNASSPVVAGNRVFISTSYDIFGAMLDVRPDMTCEVAYKTKSYASHWTTPILRDGYLYGFANNYLTCMEWTTGKRMWRKQLKMETGTANEEDSTPGTGRGADQYREPPGRTRFGFGSLILADRRFLCLGETGLVAWLDLSPEGCRLLNARRLFTADQTWTAPVLSRGLLYVAQNLPDGEIPPRLLCYDLRADGKDGK